MLSIKREEVPKIVEALGSWFKSQNLTPLDATYVCMKVAGIGIAFSSVDSQHLEEGIRVSTKIMERTARIGFKQKKIMEGE